MLRPECSLTRSPKQGCRWQPTWFRSMTTRDSWSLDLAQGKPEMSRRSSRKAQRDESGTVGKGLRELSGRERRSSHRPFEALRGAAFRETPETWAC
jgi:hypothetical protein